MLNRYSTQIFWSEEDEGFVVLIPEFPTFVAFGETREEAVAEAGKALECLINSLQSRNIPLPEPALLPEHSGQLRLRLPKSLHSRLALAAEKEGVSLNTYIVALLSRDCNSTAPAELSPQCIDSLSAKIAEKITESNVPKSMDKQIADAVSSLGNSAYIFAHAATIALGGSKTEQQRPVTSGQDYLECTYERVVQ